MCCKADKKLTKRYQKRPKAFAAWKVRRRNYRGLVSPRHDLKTGGCFDGPGRVTSTRSLGRWRKDQGDLVYAGNHWFVSKKDAEVEMRRTIAREGGAHLVVRVMVDPAEVIAVGDLWLDDGRMSAARWERADGRILTGVSTAVELLPQDWKKAMGN